MIKIKQSLNTALDELADKLEHVQWHGEYFAASCAFHSPDSRPSMMVYPDGYKCLGCGAHGSIKYLAQKLNSTNIFIVQEPKTNAFPMWNNWLRQFKTWEGVVNAAHHNLISYPQYRKYFVDRRVDDETVECELGYLDGWYMFPVYDKNGELQTIVVRAGRSTNTDVKYALRPRQNPDDSFLYVPDWSKIDEYRDVYIPFGIIDALSLLCIGLPSVTGTTGHALHPRLLEQFRAPIWIIPDRNEDKPAVELYSGLGWRGRLLYLDYPQDCKDSNDVLVNYGSSMLTELISDAKIKCVQTLHQQEH